LPLLIRIGSKEQNPLQLGDRILRASAHFHDSIVAHVHQKPVTRSQAEGLASLAWNYYLVFAAELHS